MSIVRQGVSSPIFRAMESWYGNDLYWISRLCPLQLPMDSFILYTYYDLGKESDVEYLPVAVWIRHLRQRPQITVRMHGLLYVESTGPCITRVMLPRQEIRVP